MTKSANQSCTEAAGSPIVMMMLGKSTFAGVLGERFSHVKQASSSPKVGRGSLTVSASIFDTFFVSNPSIEMLKLDLSQIFLVLVLLKLTLPEGFRLRTVCSGDRTIENRAASLLAASSAGNPTSVISAP